MKKRTLEVEEDIIMMQLSARRSQLGWLAAVVIGIMVVAVSAPMQAVTLVHISSGSHAVEWHQWLEWMAVRFEEKTGIKVEVDVAPSGHAYREQVMVRTAAGLAPDITDFNRNVGAQAVQERLFVDLTPYVEASGMDLSQYPPVSIAGATAPGGYLWGLPVSILPIPVYFNVDMFREAGLSTPIELGDDWTWDTYYASARALTIHDPDGLPIRAGTIDPRRRWQQMLEQGGGPMFDEYEFFTESYLNRAGFVDAFDWRQRFVDNNLIALTGGVWNGDVAITNIDAPTIINKYKGGFNMDAAIQPKGPAGRGAHVNPDVVQIHRDSPHKEEAWQWVHFLVTDIEGLEKFVNMTGRLAAVREVMLRYPELSRDELTPNWYALIETAFSPDAFPPYMFSDGRITDILDAEFDGIWKGTVAPSIALQKAHEQITAVLADLNK